MVGSVHPTATIYFYAIVQGGLDGNNSGFYLIITSKLT
jgi:hypothetical protein